MKDIKELFYESDTRKHQQLVEHSMIQVAKLLLDRAVSHDTSKLETEELSYYVEPVYHLNTEDIVFGSARYKELTAQMGEGWEHHKLHNDHHIEHFESVSGEAMKEMNLLQLIEMICDWIAASKRKGNRASRALDMLMEKYHVDEQLEAVIRNTITALGEE